MMKYGFDHTTGDGQKRLMDLSMGRDPETHVIKYVPKYADGRDYGCDPVGNGKFRMVPSGDVVDYAERCRRLKK
jgi:hypothetical protein